MDNVRGFEEDRIGSDPDPDMVDDAPTPAIGTDERRMHVRAYNHWVSLLQGRAYPSIEDLDPASIADFGPHSVLLDFSRGSEDPAIAFLGRALRDECGLDGSATMISHVPSRSLLSRLTDHYLQIIANRAPIGFEAEFISSRGHNTMYRGILMPFSSDEDTIDFIYGVINWKELVDAGTQAGLDAEIEASVRTAPRAAATAPVWADGPSAERDDPEEATDAAPRAAGSLADQLMLAQQTAAAVRAADTRSRATLYRALGRAHDFAAAADQDPQGYEALLDTAGITLQLRAPMTPVAKLIFGADYDKTRLTEYATVLSHARRIGVGTGGLETFLESIDGGIKGVVQAERGLRRPATGPARDHSAALRDRPSLARVTLDTKVQSGGYVVLLARADDSNTLQIVAAIEDEALTAKAMRAAA
ncbi:hypothetical protein [Sphingomonas endolithica]|uniref:PAS domain-containing protein n=1 Tax=Sphingomonas endolithica TaxID=2972485 RepID=UPI0021AF2CBD|nr:hypothetical protein [Sphingomonas sp. ZFBP2030]